MRSAFSALALLAAFALAPAKVSAQPLYSPSSGAGSFGPGNYGGLTTAAPASTNFGAGSFAPTGGAIQPYGRANLSDSALSRGPNMARDPHFYGGYFNGQIYVHPTYQSPADLMNGPRRSTRAPFQYLPGPNRP